MEKCVILCRLKIETDATLDYDSYKTICIGSFPDHESAGDFMTECIDNDKSLKECLKLLYSDDTASIDRWEVADYIDMEYVAKKWEDHSTACRSHAERGQFSYSK